jgi:hypothetical protein
MDPKNPGEFVIQKRRRTRRPPTLDAMMGTGTRVGDCILPEYLVTPPTIKQEGDASGRYSLVDVKLQSNHPPELFHAFGVARDILGTSFRPLESNLAIGKICF